jgi:hypothetical protein
MSTNNELPIEQRVSLLEAKLRVVVEGLTRLGYEQDGPNRLTERFGVDAAACRKILSAIGGDGTPTSLQTGPAKENKVPPGQNLFKPVAWSKDPSFRFG